MADICLHQYPISPFCDKVRRVLNAKQLDYRCENISLLATLLGRVKRLSPVGKLPVLSIDGRSIADSTTIVEELEQLYPRINVMPDDPADQALVHFFEDWADESLYFLKCIYALACAVMPATGLSKPRPTITPNWRLCCA